jgi:cysteine desulfurase
LGELGWEISRVDCDPQGIVQPQAFEAAIRPNTRLASIIHGSHRIGTIQPLRKIARICHERDILLHSDAAQSVGKVPINVEQMGVDLLSLSGHKFYAPKGVGALFVRLGVPLDPILCGDNGEGGLRPGTLNLPGIVGMGQAATLVSSDIERSAEQLERLRSVFVDELQAALAFEIDVHGSRAKRMPHILSFELPGVSALEMQRLLPEICFSCHALHGLGRQAEIAAGKAATVAGLTVPEATNAIRLSFGWTSNEEDVRRAAQMFAAAYESLSPGN